MLLLRKIWKIPSDAYTLILAFSDSHTPAVSRVLICAAFIYLFSPVDLIPDFIPIAGWIDDLVVVPAIILFVTKHLPPLVLIKARKKAIKYKRLFLLFALLFASGIIFLLFYLTKLIFF